MNIILFNPFHKFGKGIYRAQRKVLPLGLLAVATPLDAAEYKVKIIDQQLMPQWKNLLLAEIKKRPVCIGITCMTGPQIQHALEASKLIRQNSNIPVVWGGVHPSILPQQTLENENVDIVVQGEGEETFLELVQTLESAKPLRNVKGIWYKDNGRIQENAPRPFIDLNEQAPLAYHLLDVEAYLENRFGNLLLKIFSSRGCNHSCTFCYNTSFNRGRWRALSAEETVKRLKGVVDTYGVKGFIFSDDNFFNNPARARKILKGIIREGLDLVLYKLDIRLDTLFILDDDFLELIKKSGCISLSIGLETGSERIQKLLKKKVAIPQVLAVNRRLKKLGIMATYTFMMGYPTETLEELKETVSLIIKLLEENPNITKSLHIYTPLPGSELFAFAVRHGLQVPQRLEDWIQFNYRMVNLPWLSGDRRKLLEMLHFSTLFLRDKTLFNLEVDIHPLNRLLAKIVRPLADWRVKNFYYKYPIEIRLAEWLHFYRRQSE